MVADVQYNGTSVVTNNIAYFLDDTFLSAATIAKWKAILEIS